MTGTYAARIEVASTRSRDEIERTLVRYGAQQFASGWAENRAMIGLVADGRQVRFLLPLPDPKSPEFIRSPTGRGRSAAAAANEAYEQAVRQKWRALALVIKAKLEAVQAGIVTFEDEFAMHMVLPDGQTVRTHVLPAIAEAYESGSVPALLPHRALAITGG